MKDDDAKLLESMYDEVAGVPSQPVSFTDVGSPTRGIVWKVVKNGERVFLEFKPYESFTPAGVDPMPFK